MQKKDGPKVLLFDIECSNLKGDFGYVHCIGYMFLGDKKPVILSQRESRSFRRAPYDDRALLERFRPIIEGADLCVAHYGQRFDRTFLNTRLFIHGQPPYAIPPLVDPWHIARYQLALGSNRLDAISRALPDDGVQKTHITNEDWMAACAGDIKALKQIEHHCYMDILVLKKAYLALRPFMLNHPHLGKLMDAASERCPKCNSLNLQSRGTYPTARGIKRRLSCMDCGSWHVVSQKVFDKTQEQIEEANK